MFEFGMVKLVILLLTGPFIKFDCWRYRCLSERIFLLWNLSEIDGNFKSVRAIHSVRLIRVRLSEVWLYPLILFFYDHLKLCDRIMVWLFPCYLSVCTKFIHNNLLKFYLTDSSDIFIILILGAESMIWWIVGDSTHFLTRDPKVPNMCSYIAISICCGPVNLLSAVNPLFKC